LNARQLLLAIAILVSWAVQGPALAQYASARGYPSTVGVAGAEARPTDRDRPGRHDRPALAGRIQAGGRTAAQVEQAIAANLAPQYTDELDVTVQVLPTRVGGARDPADGLRHGRGRQSRPVPGREAYNRSAGDCLGGGLSPFAAERRIQVHRQVGGQDQIHVFDFRAFKHGVNPAGNIVLAPGDVIVVPERGLFE
jgi:polysaccharide biosynthesis/export protein